MRATLIVVGLTAFVFVHALAASNPTMERGASQSERGVVEELVQFRPSGRTIIRRWRDPVTRELLKIEMVGAVSGEPVFAGAKLLRNQLGEWRVRFDDGSACLVYQKADNLNKPMACTDHRGRKWVIEVKSVSEPVAIPGAASEEEPRLTISFGNHST